MSQNPVYTVTEPKKERKPVLLSVPHSGTRFPDEIKSVLKPEFVENPVDTDWFVDRLYDFAPQMGITMVVANLSRYVIDLNRASDDSPLYSDRRAQMPLVPTKSFALKDLYLESVPDSFEIERRKELYYQPYYDKIEGLLRGLKSEFENVLFFDAHSIKRVVTSIRKEKFSDLTLGDNDGKSATSQVTQAALDFFESKKNYQFSHNSPFKGGNLTRYFGRPERGIHALQLEMSQDVYMDEEKTLFDESKASGVQSDLRSLLTRLIAVIQNENLEV